MRNETSTRSYTGRFQRESFAFLCVRLRPLRFRSSGRRVQTEPRQTRRNQKGVALLLVLWLIVILGAIGASVATGARTSSAIASNVRARTVARFAAESGIEATLAELGDSLSIHADAPTRADYLNALPDAFAVRDSTPLGNARFVVAVIDVSARLDVNTAGERALTTFFAQFTDLNQAADIARTIRERIEGPPSTFGAVDTTRSPIVYPLRSLEELRQLSGIPASVLDAAAPFLTIDGDGTINRRTAPPQVMAAATGELRDEPSRLLVVSRGWLGGHPLSHEIQGVYAITGGELVLVHWRERDR